MLQIDPPLPLFIIETISVNLLLVKEQSSNVRIIELAEMPKCLLVSRDWQVAKLMSFEPTLQKIWSSRSVQLVEVKIISHFAGHLQFDRRSLRCTITRMSTLLTKKSHSANENNMLSTRDQQVLKRTKQLNHIADVFVYLFLSRGHNFFPPSLPTRTFLKFSNLLSLKFRFSLPCSTVLNSPRQMLVGLNTRVR